MAALVTCLVQTLNETDPSFQERFLANAEKAYYKFRDNTDGAQELELLNWTREYLTGFKTIKGQGKPFLAD